MPEKSQKASMIQWVEVEDILVYSAKHRCWNGTNLRLPGCWFLKKIALSKALKKS